ncbi:MAG TPA: ABC transporter permease [Acidimicrobiales bacterium]|nr:ABC transporter permease [Acidimicrobiales bacterium]
MATTISGPRRPDPAPLAGRATRVVAWIRELAGARDLTANLVRRDLKVRHRGTFLGMLWSLTTPLLIVGLYYFIFKLLFPQSPATDVARPDGRSVPFAVYFFAGLTIWNLFASSILTSATSVTSAGYMLNKVYFPRAILPLSTVLSALVTFGFELCVLLLVTLAVVGLPSAQLLWLPVIVAVVVALAFGLAMLLSAVNVFLRDTAHFLAVFVQLWFWGTPIIYSLRFVSRRPGLARLLKLNPMTGTVVSFRNVVVLNHAPSFKLLAYDVGCALVALVIGATVFARFQRTFSEIV